MKSDPQSAAGISKTAISVAAARAVGALEPDLSKEDLPTGLARHGYDASQRTFVVMEGLTMYVPEEALRATFPFVA